MRDRILTFDSLPINNIAILFLIISGNYLGELIPCKIQKSLSANIYLKHLLGYLTMVFFVTLNDSLAGNNLGRTFLNSFILYLIFMIAIKSNTIFFYISLTFLMIIYLLSIQINIYLDEANPENDNKLSLLLKARKAFKIMLLISIAIGFLLYIGEKKIEYKGSFKYTTFLFGKSNCKNETPTRNMLQSLKALFNIKK